MSKSLTRDEIISKMSIMEKKRRELNEKYKQKYDPPRPTCSSLLSLDTKKYLNKQEIIDMMSCIEKERAEQEAQYKQRYGK